MSPEYRTDMFDGKWLTTADLHAMGECVIKCPACQRRMPGKIANPVTGECPFCSPPDETRTVQMIARAGFVDPLNKWREEANQWRADHK